MVSLVIIIISVTILLLLLQSIMVKVENMEKNYWDEFAEGLYRFVMICVTAKRNQSKCICSGAERCLCRMTTVFSRLTDLLSWQNGYVIFVVNTIII